MQAEAPAGWRSRRSRLPIPAIETVKAYGGTAIADVVNIKLAKKAVAAGADLVYMGTRFLATEESMASAEYKQMIVDHRPDDLIITDGITGTPASWLRSSLVANGLDPDRLAKPTERVCDSTAGMAARWKDLWAAGQGLQAIRAALVPVI